MQYIGPGQVEFTKCQWVMVDPPSPDKGVSDFRHVAPSPRSFTKLHVGLLNRQWGGFDTTSDMTVFNKYNAGAEGRDPGHLALFHDLIVYNMNTGAWEGCRQSGWYYSSQYHYFMQLNLHWGSQPPCGANRYYFNSGWSWQYEAGTGYYGNVGSGVLYAPYGAQQFAAAASADTSVAGPVPPPPSEDFLQKHKPPKPDKGKADKDHVDSPAVSHSIPA
jgi:hypothetical protein